MSESLASIRRDIKARLAELEPVVVEAIRLESALAELDVQESAPAAQTPELRAVTVPRDETG